MNQLCLVLPLPRARRLDPDTSHAAAAKAARFAAGHYTLIIDALRYGPATIREIAARAGIDHVAVARRTSELQDAGIIDTTSEKRAGCREWRLT